MNRIEKSLKLDGVPYLSGGYTLRIQVTEGKMIFPEDVTSIYQRLLTNNIRVGLTEGVFHDYESN